jgi:glutamine synthetase
VLRQALKNVLAEAREIGFDYRVSIEAEFFVFEDRAVTRAAQPLAPVDRTGYFEIQEVRAATLCRAAIDALRGFGVEVEATHAEVGPGQHEIDIAELDALAAADAVVALKWALRSLARRAHMLVSFMPKPLEDAPGSGLHITQMLMDSASAENSFYDPAEHFGLSEVGAQFIAGQLAHARGLSAILAPLVNSYKRLAGGGEAPARVTWARIHRGALLRVPEAAAGRGTCLELRAPDPSCNPYLALAAMLKSGLDGVRNRLPLPEPADDHLEGLDAEGAEVADPLPATLGEALEELNWDPVVRDALGQPIFERFLTAKEQEWLAFGRHISSWELARYLEGA